MAFTRKYLKTIGIEEEQIPQIIEAHLEVVNSIKEELTQKDERIKELENAHKKMGELEKQSEELEKLKADYEKEKKAFADYKADVENKEANATKEKLSRAYFENKGITGKGLDIALKASKSEISGLEIEDGKIKDAKILDDLFENSLKSLVVSTNVDGTTIPNPPDNKPTKYTDKKEIMKIKDTTERQNALLEYLNNGGK